MVLEELQLHLAAFTWVWDWRGITDVAYFVAPGVQLTARWVNVFT
jgi:hypothetical protein